ncbi:Rho GTPase, putative [Entamoeba invadens IP1]|uniref:small monomeric GTPase n=1 Tax=Entamoeba invadens IP1 TaxID=370355 RepID=A0A0A1TXF5_ENTIV|nr:Rho GTPase, putative [Entamoeba invadens IP1]ELP84190.1 Rho GTPase, putative [Entamoeba invadens IP1]|eukprot:XP_004183536.1 Rho GTPase, putative [Entamoeba invadens IP1]
MLKTQKKEFNVLFVGEGASGKTQVVSCLNGNAYIEEYNPTIEDIYHLPINDHFYIKITDVAGQLEYTVLVEQYYETTDCIFICFSINDWNQFERTKTWWYDEIRKKSLTVPVFLVGTKADLKENEYEKNYLKSVGKKFVSSKDAINMAMEIGALGYVECSAKFNVGINFLFEKLKKIANDKMAVNN